MERRAAHGCALSHLARSPSPLPHSRALTLPLEILSLGPDLAIRTPKLDFGLVPLGDTHELTLTFDNLTGREAKWMLFPAPLPRSDRTTAQTAEAAAAAQAAALGLPYPPPPLPELEWHSWDDRAPEGSTAHREHAAMDSRLLDLHGTTGLRPGLCCGTVGAHEAVSVKVLIDAAAEQSLRTCPPTLKPHALPTDPQTPRPAHRPSNPTLHVVSHA